MKRKSARGCCRHIGPVFRFFPFASSFIERSRWRRHEMRREHNERTAKKKKEAKSQSSPLFGLLVFMFSWTMCKIRRHTHAYKRAILVLRCLQFRCRFLWLSVSHLLLLRNNQKKRQTTKIINLSSIWSIGLAAHPHSSIIICFENGIINIDYLRPMDFRIAAELYYLTQQQIQSAIFFRKENNNQ